MEAEIRAKIMKEMQEKELKVAKPGDGGGKPGGNETVPETPAAERKTSQEEEGKKEESKKEESKKDAGKDDGRKDAIEANRVAALAKRKAKEDADGDKSSSRSSVKTPLPS